MTDNEWKFRKLEAGVSPTDYRETLSREGLLEYLKEREATFDGLYHQQRSENTILKAEIAELRDLCGRALGECQRLRMNCLSVGIIPLNGMQFDGIIDELKEAAEW